MSTASYVYANTTTTTTTTTTLTCQNASTDNGDDSDGWRRGSVTNGGGLEMQLRLEPQVCFSI